MKRKLTAGLTSVTLPIFVQATNVTNGGGLAGLAHNTAGLVCEYRRQGQSTWTAIPLVAGTLGTWGNGGNAANGTIVVDGSDPGCYELSIPDAVTAPGARWAAIRLYGAANMLGVKIELELDTLNYQASGGKVPATIAAGDMAPNSIDASALAASAVQEIAAGITFPAVPSASDNATAILAATVGEDSLADLLLDMGAALVGKSSGAETGTVVFALPGSDATRLTYVTDTNNNRLTVTRSR